MHDRTDLVVADRRADLRIVGDVRLDQSRAGIDRPVEAGDQIVDHDHLMPRVEQRQDRMAADIAGAARYHHPAIKPWTVDHMRLLFVAG